MSTRGCVAVKKDDGWEGVYNHYDSYPRGLGEELWEELKSRDLHAFAEDLLRFTDWREYLSEGECEYCGKRGVGQPHSISKVTGTVDEEIQENLDRCGYPDPEAEYHKHSLDGGVSVEETHITSSNPNPLSMEWVYIIDPDERTIEILANQFEELKSPEEGKLEPTPEKGGWWDYGISKWRHFKVAEIDIDGTEPDWEKIGEKGRRMRKERRMNH